MNTTTTPTTHTAKFIAIFASLPFMFGVICLTLSNASTSIPVSASIYAFGSAIVLLGIAIGVYRKNITAAYIGIALFIFAILTFLLQALRTPENLMGVVFWIALCYIPIRKLQDAITTMRTNSIEN